MKKIFRFFNWSKFRGVNRLFVLSFKDDDGRESHKQYYLPNIEIKYYNVNNKIFFDHTIKSDLKTYDNIGKIVAGQDDDYRTGYLLD